MKLISYLWSIERKQNAKHMKNLELTIGMKFTHFYGNGEASGGIETISRITESSVFTTSEFKGVKNESEQRQSHKTVQALIKKGCYKIIK